MAHPTHAQLEALLEDDPAGFARALGTHAWFERTLAPFVATLQARPELAEAVAAHVPAYRARAFATWMTRRVLSLEQRDHASFCALATRVARERDPDFPELPTGPLVVATTWYAGSIRRFELEQGERGWLLEIEERDVGPAEAIHEEEWTARARGPGWVVTTRLTWSGDDLRVWAEE